MRNTLALRSPRGHVNVTSLPRTFNELGVASSGDHKAMTISMQSVSEDRKRIARILIAGAPESEVPRIGGFIAETVMSGGVIDSPLLQLKPSGCFVVQGEHSIYGFCVGNGAIYLSQQPGGKLSGPYPSFSSNAEFSGYVFALDQALRPEDLEELRRISARETYPEVIAEKFSQVLREKGGSVAIAVLGARLPITNMEHLLNQRVVEVHSHRGMRRPNNEDSALGARVKYSTGGLTRSFSLLLVADGAGGHRFGEVASRVAVSTVFRSVVEMVAEGDPLSLLESSVYAANERVLKFRGESRSDAATTLTAGLIKENKVYVAHCGDSRMYLVGERAALVTEDHKYVTELVKRGLISEREARHHPQRNIITSALGMEKPRVDLHEVSLRGDEIILLCTDGLTDVVEDWEIERYLRSFKLPKDIAWALINLANSRGGPDNISIATSVPLSQIFTYIPK